MKGILCWVILTRCPHVRVIGAPAPPSHWNFKHTSDRHWFGACTCWPLAGIPPSFPSASLVCSAGEVVRAAWPLVVPLWMARSDAARETDSSVWWNGTENMIYSLHALTPSPAEEESGEGSWEVGREAWREEELEDRQDLYLQCCKLILHFIDALFNQCQIFVVMMASLQRMGLAEPGDLIWFIIFWLFPQKMKLIILLFLLWDIDLNFALCSKWNDECHCKCIFFFNIFA